MRIRIAYKANGKDVLEEGQINNFPRDLWVANQFNRRELESFRRHALIISCKESVFSGFYGVNFIFSRYFLFFFLVSFLLSFYFFFSKACGVGKVRGWACIKWKLLHFVEIEIPRSVLLLFFFFLLLFLL